jgi:hypothetical protein
MWILMLCPSGEAMQQVVVFAFLDLGEAAAPWNQLSFNGRFLRAEKFASRAEKQIPVRSG